MKRCQKIRRGFTFLIFLFFSCELSFPQKRESSSRNGEKNSPSLSWVRRWGQRTDWNFSPYGGKTIIPRQAAWRDR